MKKKIFFILIFLFLIFLFLYYFASKKFTYLRILKIVFSSNEQITRILNLEESLNEQNFFIKKLIEEKNFSYNQSFFPSTQFLELNYREAKLPIDMLDKKDRKLPTYSSTPVSSFYLDILNNDGYIIGRYGQLFKFDVDFLLKKNELKFKKINNNLNKSLIVTDLLINSKNFYVATFDESNCSSMIFVGIINDNFIDFKLFYQNKYIDKCYKHPTGGRLALFDKTILFTTDAYQFIGNEKSAEIFRNGHLGAVLGIDLLNQKTKLISKGHRNPQGLVVINNQDILITEHGPKGGDEINKILLGKDYGWPEVSLGEPYDFDIKNKNYVLKKNHKLNGYEEPIYAFVPSIGISQIIKVEKEFASKWENSFLITSLNGGVIYRVVFNYDYTKIIFSEEIKIGKRIRDIIYAPMQKFFILALENDNGSLGIISVK